MNHVSSLTKPAFAGRAILVVDDEVLIRALICDVLRDAGARVIEAENADEALKCLAIDPTVGVVFTDIRMPGSMDRLQMRDRIASTHPHIKIVMTSGHLLAREAPHGTLFFSKPYNLEQIAAKLVLLLDDVSDERSANG